MPSKKVVIDADGSGLAQTLDMLTTKAKDLESTLARIGTAINGGDTSAGTRGNFFSTVQQLQGTRGAIDALQSSSPSSKTGIINAVRGGASGALMPFRDVVTRGGDIGSGFEGAFNTLPGSGATMQMQNAMFFDPKLAQMSGASQNAIVRQLVSSVQGSMNSNPVGAGGQPMNNTGTLSFTPEMLAAMKQSNGFPQWNAGSVTNAPPAPGPNQAIMMPAGGGNQLPDPTQMMPAWRIPNPPSPPRPPRPPYQSNRLTIGGGIAVGLGTIATEALSGAMQFQTDRTLEGGSGTQDAANNYGRVIGGVGGLLLGAATGNPYVALTSMAVGSNLVGRAAEWFVRDQIVSERSHLAMNQIVSTRMGPTMNTDLMRYYTDKTHTPDRLDGSGLVIRGADGPSRFEIISANANKGTLAELNMSAVDVAKTYGNISSGLFAGGVNPEAKSNNPYVFEKRYIDTDWSKKFDAVVEQSEFSVHHGSKFPLIDQLIANRAKVSSFLTKAHVSLTTESLAETYTARIAKLYAKDAPEVSKQMAAIFATVPETGGNIADILSQYGPEQTAAFLRIQNNELRSVVDPDLLAKRSATIRGSARRAGINALRTRGSASAVEGNILSELTEIAALPNGEDSLEYAQQFASYRAAGKARFDQEQTIRYSVPMAHIQGALNRSEVLPFNPSNRYGLEMKSLAMNEREVKKMQLFMNARRASGKLSEDEELELTTKIEGLKTAEAQSVARLSDGLDDRLPGLSAGRPSSFGRFDSFQLAAMALGRQGSPIRRYGALNGAQRQMQEDFTLSFNAGNTGPYDRHMGMDNAGAHMNELTGAIKDLTRTIQGTGGVATHRGAAGGGHGAITSSEVRTMLPGSNWKDPMRPGEVRGQANAMTNGMTQQMTLPSNSRANTGSVN